jgi:hypothetical protein
MSGRPAGKPQGRHARTHPKHANPEAGAASSSSPRRTWRRVGATG